MSERDRAPERAKPLLEQFADGLRIDKHDLDNEWIHHPEIYWRVSDGLIKAQAARDKAKQELSDTVARLAADMREAYDKSGTKYTETGISRDIELEDEVKTLRREIMSLEQVAARWAALKESFHQRSYALKGITDLHLANYYQANSRADDVRKRGGEERRNR